LADGEGDAAVVGIQQQAAPQMPAGSNSSQTYQQSWEEEGNSVSGRQALAQVPEVWCIYINAPHSCRPCFAQ
jgi:hypothetical protein